jgi:hypothetical protein
MLRVVYVSVRGHKTLLGGPTLDADAAIPAGVGIEFPDHRQVEAHVRRALHGLSAYWQVHVVDDTGTVVRRGFRSGRNGTGERWTWRDAP